MTLDLSPQFMAQFELEWDESVVKSKEQSSRPSAKPDYSAIAKAAGKDKQTAQTIVSNMFQLIGELLSDARNVEVDLGVLGRFNGRPLIYSPMNAQKPSTLHGYQTVKGLMDSTYKPSYGRAGGIEPLLGPSREYEQDELGEPLIGMTGQFAYSLNSKTLAQGEPPTRRFREPVRGGKIINTLLGAGDNPQARETKISVMASDPSMLMSMSFKKPGAAKSRFPPVIDPFSRTLAAPVISMRHYLSVSHRIGTNYSPASKGYYVDVDRRMIKYKNQSKSEQAILGSDKDPIEPATEQEELEGLMNPDNADIEKIQARKDSYNRYAAYIDEEIPVDVIAPIRVYWINHILELIPADLHAIDPSRVTALVDSMLKEMNENYYNAVKKSILDYILKDESEMKRIGIYQVLNTPIDWGDNFYNQIEFGEEWKQNIMMARMLMSENLCICSQASLTLSLMELWQHFENLLFVDLPNSRYSVPLTRFSKAQHDKATEVKTKLSSDWNKRVVDILRKELESMDGDQTKTFFESVGTLMANQARGLITRSIEA